MLHKNKMGQEWFRKKVKEIHGFRYSVSHVVYDNSYQKFTLRCWKHGEFQTTGQALINKKRGCPKCGQEKARLHRKRNFLGLTNEDVIRAAREVHGDLYDYSKLQYVNTKTPFTVICKIHGGFQQSYYVHVKKGCRCPKCFPQFGAGRRIAAERFTGQVTKLTSKTVTRRCPTHGVYTASITNALYKDTRCPKCATKSSKWQKEVTAFVKRWAEEVKTDHRIFKGSSKNVDIFIPSLNLAIECHGAYHHSTGARNYRAIPVEVREADVRKEELWKHRECRKLGVRLVTILENEWHDRRLAVEDFIKVLLGKSESIGARELKCEQIDAALARSFLERYHLQGAGTYSPSVKYYALKDPERVYSVMAFTTSRYRRSYETGNGWDILRYAACMNVRGGAERLLTNFMRDVEPTEVISFCDSRLFTGGVYERLGFVKVKEYPFDYMFLKGKKLYHKAHFTKRRLQKLGIEDASFASTEAANIFKLFLPGQVKYRLLK